jgi:cytochrome c5
MSKRKLTTIKLALALAAMTLAINASFHRTTRAAQQDLPEGKGVEIARDKCLLCHEADLIVSQRLSRQGWTREVEKMVRWGAVVSDAEKAILVDYFAAHFAPRRVAVTNVAMTSEARGKEIFENQCLICHEADLTAQQRLSRQGWTREVEKMIRWGATVTDAEKEPLVDYLFKNFGPRPLASGR